MKIQFFGALVLLAGCLPLPPSHTQPSLPPSHAPSPILQTEEAPLTATAPITPQSLPIRLGQIKEIDLGLTEKILALSIHPQNEADWLIVTEKGLLQSQDAGLTWHVLGSPGTFYCHSGNMVLSRDSDNPMYLKSVYWFPNGLGVADCFSLDGGKTWESKKEQNSSFEIDKYLPHPKQPTLKYGLQRGNTQRAGLLIRSNDQGQTWKTLPSVSSAHLYHDIWLDPTLDDVIYLFVIGSGTYRSEDQGESWQLWNQDFYGIPVVPHAWQFKPNEPDYVLVTVAGRLFKSTDRGQHFKQWQGLPAAITANPIWSPDSTKLYIGTEKGVYLWNGHDWKANHTFLSFGDIQILKPHPAIPNQLFGFAGQHFFSLNAQSQQVKWGESLPASVHQFLIVPQAPHRFYAATEQGLYRSDDSGQSWLKEREVSQQGTRIGNNEWVSALSWNPQNNELWAGISTQTLYSSDSNPGTYNYQDVPGALFTKTDSEKLWQKSSHYEPNWQFELQDILGIWFVPSAVGWTQYASFNGGHYTGLFKYTPQAQYLDQKWTKVKSFVSGNEQIQMIVGVSDKHYYALGLKGTLFSGGPDPASWQRQGQIPDCRPPDPTHPIKPQRSPCRALLVAPSNPQHLLAGSPSGLWQSFDGGKNWQKWESPLTDVYTLAMDQEHQLYIGSNKGLYYVSVPLTETKSTQNAPAKLYN